MKTLITFILFSFPLAFSTFASECDLRSPLKVYRPHYAKHFSIDYFKNFKILHVDKEQYLLSDSPVQNCEYAGLKIITPVKKVVMMSTTYLPALELIHQEKSLMGFQGKQNIVSSAFQQGVIKEVAYKLNPEYLQGFKADLIMGYEGNLTGPKQTQIFKSLKIPFVINKDFEEKNPLARAEWLIFISSFYNQDDQAINIFNSIQSKYLALKEKNSKFLVKAKVIVGDIQNGHWVTCGGESDLGQMIEDAGGSLAHKRPSSKTQEINLEEISLDKTIKKVWLTHNMWESKNDLVKATKKDSRYLLITAKNMFNNNLIINSHKANDYWEMGLQRPDLLLFDLSKMFHPEEYKEHKLHWYRKL
jgi:iron complex transport system substrate-binding protein